MWVSEFYPKENFNDRKTALGIPEILYKVIYLRPRVARTAAASSATSGREQNESRPRVADFFLAWRMTLALSNVEKITSAILPLASNILFTMVLKIQIIQGW